MNSHFFPRLAADNIKKNKAAYVPYLLTCILTVSMFYIVTSLSLNPGLATMRGFDILSYLLAMGSKIIAIFALVFLFYTNSFLVKRRKKEFAVFNILGMEKRHLAKTLAFETLYIAAASFAGGLVLGLALDKAMYLLITRLVGGEISLGFFVSPRAIETTLFLFSGIFLLIYLYSALRLKISNPLELLREGSAGEKEPKTKGLLALSGLACIGGGYYISLTVTNPVSSISLFAVAVLLVIAGTYLVFTAGSVALFKMLRKNKRYYYKTNHFISVSGMIYRMKQNAVGLANICILSTMVLVTVSFTSSLMVGMEDVVKTRYPNDFCIYSDETDETKSGESFELVRSLQKEQSLNVTAEREYSYLTFMTLMDKDSFLVLREISVQEISSIVGLVFLPLSDYNAMTGEQKTLGDGEVLIYSSRMDFERQELRVLNRTYSVKETLTDFEENGNSASDITSSLYIVVKDMNELQTLCGLQEDVYNGIASKIRHYYGFDSDADEETQTLFYQELVKQFGEREYSATLESRAEERAGIVEIHGGLFFIGIFLGFLFIMATVLIIYYKQISEGYEDKKRFEIMQKAGLSHQEIKSSIHSQVLTVFFLPLITAGIHVMAAFPLMSKILVIFNLTNTGLYIACAALCFLAFSLMYTFVYLLTAGTYDRIVK